jgi:succinate dehydrogenase hydrophobic anchor subunit
MTTKRWQNTAQNQGELKIVHGSFTIPPMSVYVLLLLILSSIHVLKCLNVFEQLK